MKIWASAVAAACAASLPAAVRAGLSWQSVGAPLLRPSISTVAVDVCTGAAAGAELGGDPVLAVGYANSTTGGTDIGIFSLNDTANRWQPVAVHSPQFPQSYSSFKFRCRGGAQYLGVQIGDGEDLASVLKSGSQGYNGFEGCYAFTSAFGQSFDFDVNDAGDGSMRLLNTADNVTASIETYGAAGWATYPATDAWGPSTTVATGAAAIDNVVVVRGPTGTLYGAYVAGGVVQAVSFQLANTTSFSTVGQPFPGDGLGLAYANGVLCASTVNATDDGSGWGVRVRCIRDGATASDVWSDLGVAAVGVLQHTTSTIAVTSDGVVFAGGAGTNTSSAAVAACTLQQAQPPAVACVAGGWAAAPVVVQGTLQGFALRFNEVTGEVYAVATSGLGDATDAVYVARAVASTARDGV